MTDEEHLRYMRDEMPVFGVLVRKPGQNSYEGYIENSMSMALDQERLRVWWTGTGHSVLGSQKVDGEEDASFNAISLQHHHPDWEVRVVNLRDPECPITIDFEQWAQDMAQGARRKFDNRNPLFKIKEDPAATAE